jgi:hypothetical protein
MNRTGEKTKTLPYSRKQNIFVFPSKGKEIRSYQPLQNMGIS